MLKKIIARVGITVALLGASVPALAQEVPNPGVVLVDRVPAQNGGTLAEVPATALPSSMAFDELPTFGDYRLEAGHRYVFETFDLVGRTDTVIELRRAAGPSHSASDAVIATNDDAGGTLASRIDITAMSGGEHYVVVRPYAEQTGGTFGFRAVEAAPRRVVMSQDSMSLGASPAVAATPTLTAGRSYIIETFGLSANADTILTLRSGGATLAENDDADGLASRIVFTAPATGAFEIGVRPYAPNTTGTFGIRILELAEGEEPPTSMSGPSPGCPLMY